MSWREKKHQFLQAFQNGYFENKLLADTPPKKSNMTEEYAKIMHEELKKSLELASQPNNNDGKWLSKGLKEILEQPVIDMSKTATQVAIQEEMAKRNWTIDPVPYYHEVADEWTMGGKRASGTVVRGAARGNKAFLKLLEEAGLVAMVQAQLARFHQEIEKEHKQVEDLYNQQQAQLHSSSHLANGMPVSPMQIEALKKMGYAQSKSPQTLKNGIEKGLEIIEGNYYAWKQGVKKTQTVNGTEYQHEETMKKEPVREDVRPEEPYVPKKRKIRLS